MKFLTSTFLSRLKSSGTGKSIAAVFGKCHLAPRSPLPAAEENTVLYDADEFFHQTYDRGLKISGTPDRGHKRRSRFFNLIQALEATNGLTGDAIECGCWRGLSSYLTCEYLRRRNPTFHGRGFTVLDSFEGLSDPGSHDSIERDIVRKGVGRKGRPFKGPGAYAASMEHVRGVLNEFPDVEFVKGWIPEVLATLPEREYRFVHVDLDLYAPIRGALYYFYPKLVQGGVLVCDDYGSLFWPGAKKAVDEFCKESGGRLLANSTGQALIFKF